ncbi:MAG: Xaa-Pro peptidase family protein [Candidatus Latescibacteria bacterium]|jgi:Xaa-Pro dipeptidase|nr:Xaa-Pro peptidase family protein [Candidatus Latescibacterota bacterium]
MTEAPELPFPLDEYRFRLERVRARMDKRGLDLLLVHNLSDQCYLTGYQTFDPVGYSCFFLPLEGEPVIQVWKAETANVRLNAWVEEIESWETATDPFQVTRRILEERGWAAGRIGVDEEALTLGDYRRLQDAIGRSELVNLTHFISTVALVKTPREIDLIRRAGGITQLGMDAAIAAAVPGATDNDIAAAGYGAMIGGGSEYMCYAPIVTSGARSGTPHTTHKRNPLASGDPVFLEFGACIHRYSAPQMRTAILSPSAPELTRMAEGCLTALNDVIAAAKPGITGDELAQAGSRGVEMAGPDVYYHGVFACSVGLGFPPTWEDHPTFLTAGSTTVLEPGMVYHLPIAFRLAGKGCVGFSETLVVTDDGCEVLTQGERALVVK